ncbi:MAG: DEAD/DEAH box helicase [Syntrophomonadaceae bacterium]|nr:DEAD/DEAH box helicase [Syntrophomonadaceae bacterium]MDD4549657.1 DEAD/DEAH box helicase [Syntrophomonadaceae bacterium]
MGFEEATPIQAMTIPVALAGKDLIGRAQTGTGKTAAFGIPLADRCDMELDYIQGIVITPTRELAMQVAEELNRIGQHKNVRCLPIYGGQEIERQIRALKKRPQIVVGTPGRLLDHLRRRTIRLNQIKILVLDEADEMLNMGFKEDIEDILKQMPAERQTLLFSATMPPHIQALAREFMNDPQLIHINPREITVSNIEQQYMETPESQKLDILCRLLDIHNPALAIVFGRTKRRVDELAEALSKRGYSAEGIHGDLTQNRRDTIMRQFKGGTIDILVATDVAARGLDISGVTHIYNFDIPQDPEGYVHRIGRTGRAGETGLATTFVTPREISHLRYIEQLTKHKITRKPVPTVNEVFAGLQRVVVENLLSVSETDRQPYKKLAESLLEDHDSVSLLSAALKILTREPLNTSQVLSEAPPIKIKEPRNKKQDYKRKANSWRNSKRAPGGKPRSKRDY